MKKIILIMLTMSLSFTSFAQIHRADQILADNLSEILEGYPDDKYVVRLISMYGRVPMFFLPKSSINTPEDLRLCDESPVSFVCNVADAMKIFIANYDPSTKGAIIFDLEVFDKQGIGFIGAKKKVKIQVD